MIKTSFSENIHLYRRPIAKPSRVEDDAADPDVVAEALQLENEAPLPYSVDTCRSGSEDPMYYLHTLAAKIDKLVEKSAETERAEEYERDIIELKDLAWEMGKESFFGSLEKKVQEEAANTKASVVVPLGGTPLKFWEASFWTRQFPDLFCYGDGAFGLNRRTNMTFQLWAKMILTRTELDYMPWTEGEVSCPASSQRIGEREGPCLACLNIERRPRQKQPRWSAHTVFRFVVYDTWRRSEILKKARMHVRKKGFQQNLQLVAKTSAAHIHEAMSIIGSANSMQHLAQDVRVDAALRRALKDNGRKDLS